MSIEITAWLNQHLGCGYTEQVVVEARQRLAGAEMIGKLPRGAAPAGTPLAEIIERTKRKKEHDELEISVYSRWLASWAYYAIPDSETREQALSLAWERTIRGL